MSSDGRQPGSAGGAGSSDPSGSGSGAADAWADASSLGEEEAVRWKSAPPPPAPPPPPPVPPPPSDSPAARADGAIPKPLDSETQLFIRQPAPPSDETGDGGATAADLLRAHGATDASFEAVPAPYPSGYPPADQVVAPYPAAPVATGGAPEEAPAVSDYPPPAAPEVPPAAAGHAAAAEEPPQGGSYHPAAEAYAPPAAAAAPAAPATPPASAQSPPLSTDLGAHPDLVIDDRVEHPDGHLPLPLVHDPDSPLAASYRVLRHRLREVGHPSCIAVTSPSPSEGKTTCAINLAMALAEHGRERVLLLEANLREPSVSEALGFKPASCFGEQMASHVKNRAEPWHVVSVYHWNLHVLAVDPGLVGSWMMNAPAFTATMEALRPVYHQIVIDCPAALGSADVNIIEDAADGILLVGRAGRTTSKSLQRTAAHLAPANIFGVVLLDGDT